MKKYTEMNIQKKLFHEVDDLATHAMLTGSMSLKEMDRIVVSKMEDLNVNFTVEMVRILANQYINDIIEYGKQGNDQKALEVLEMQKKLAGPYLDLSGFRNTLELSYRAFFSNTQFDPIIKQKYLKELRNLQDRVFL